MKPLQSGFLVGMFAAFAAGCSDAGHEPVKLIAAPRPAVPALAPVPVPVPEPAPASVAAVAPRAAAPASRPTESQRRPGFVEQNVLQRTWQPGQPSGNADFRNAIEAKRARAAQPQAPAEAPRQ